MIPKIIHYCWFGKKEKPASVCKYIDGWSKKLPEFQIIEWNESNFNVNYNQYTKEAYQAKKYSFVSDVARLYVLYRYGGVYLDTDVEIKRSFSDLLDQHNLIMGFEYGGDHLMTAFIAAKPRNSMINEFLKSYIDQGFLKENGDLNMYPNSYRLTEIMVKRVGLKTDNTYQEFTDSLTVFPEKSFSALEFKTYTDISDATTYTIHHFDASWKPFHVQMRLKLKRTLIKVIGSKIFSIYI